MLDGVGWKLMKGVFTGVLEWWSNGVLDSIQDEVLKVGMKK
jgi:hypothetical protein